MSLKKSQNGQDVFMVSIFITSVPNFVSFSAPLCPKPPEIPVEGPSVGMIEFDPIVFDQPTEKTCAIQEENLELKCPSFLQIYIPHATFGRGYNESSSVGKMMCDGDKPDDNQAAPSANCQETDSVLLEAQTLCHGKPSCSIPISTSMATLDVACKFLKKELRTEHICGE